MIKKVLNGVEVKEYDKVIDFSDTEVYGGKIIKNKTAGIYKTPLAYYGFTGNVLNVKKIDGIYFLFTSEGYLYQYYNGKYDKVILYKFKKMPYIFRLKVNGVSKTLLIYEGVCYLTNGLNSFVFSLGEDYFFKDNYIYCLNKKEVLIANIYDLLDTTVNFYGITVNGLGNGKKIFSVLDKVFVLCEHGIAYVKLDGDKEDCSVCKMNVPSFDLAENSYCTVNGNMTFISKNKIYSFDGKQVKELKEKITGKVNKAFDLYGHYAYFANGKLNLLNPNGLDEVYYNENGDVIMGEAYYNNRERVIGEVKIGDQGVLEIIVKENFDTPNGKRLTGISVNGEEIQVEVTGDFGRHVFSVDKNSKRRLNLESKEFDFKITQKANGKLNGITLYYKK